MGRKRGPYSLHCVGYGDTHPRTFLCTHLYTHICDEAGFVILARGRRATLLEFTLKGMFEHRWSLRAPSWVLASRFPATWGDIGTLRRVEDGTRIATG